MKESRVEEIGRFHSGQGEKSGSRSLDQVKQDKDEAQNQFDTLDKSLQRKHKEFRAQQDLFQGLRESLTEVKNERLKLSSDQGGNSELRNFGSSTEVRKFDVKFGSLV